MYLLLKLIGVANCLALYGLDILEDGLNRL